MVWQGSRVKKNDIVILRDFAVELIGFARRGHRLQFVGFKCQRLGQITSNSWCWRRDDDWDYVDVADGSLATAWYQEAPFGIVVVE